jgi:hypothetical protein
MWVLLWRDVIVWPKKESIHKTTTTLSNTNNWNWIHSYSIQTSCKLVQTLFNLHIEVIPNYKTTILNLWTLMDHHTLDLLSSKLWWSSFVAIQTIDLNNFLNMSHLLNPFDSQNEPEIEKVQTSKHYNSLTKHYWFSNSSNDLPMNRHNA